MNDFLKTTTNMPVRRKPSRFTISSLCFSCLSIFFRCSGIRANHRMKTIERVLQAQLRTGANFMTAHLMVVHWSIHKLQIRDIVSALRVTLLNETDRLKIRNQFDRFSKPRSWRISHWPDKTLRPEPETLSIGLGNEQRR